MELIKENNSKQRKVFKLATSIYKTYGSVPLDCVQEHVKIMNTIMPGYILNYGENMYGTFLECKLIEGIPCNTLDRPIEEVYKFCIDSIVKTYPYMHMDWAPSNILFDGTDYHLVDWDNVGIYEPSTALAELDIDMKEYYGSRFDLFVQNLGNNFSSLRSPVLSIGSPI